MHNYEKALRAKRPIFCYRFKLATLPIIEHYSLIYKLWQPRNLKLIKLYPYCIDHYRNECSRNKIVWVEIAALDGH